MGAGAAADAVAPLPMPLPPGAPAAAAGSRRFAVLQCGPDSEYVKRVYGGYFAVYKALLREDGEEWRLFRAVEGELPGDEEVEGFEGFVVTGSCADADSDEPWIVALAALLRRLHARRKRVLGICFGHQVLCRALGGKTGRSARGWDIGATAIFPTAAAAKLFASLNLPSPLPVLEVHRDEVYKLPPLAEVLARSDHTGIEMFRLGHNILGIQGHPEYTKEILDSIVDRLHLHDFITEADYLTAKEKMSSPELAPPRDGWKRLCRGFLKGRLQEQKPIIFQGLATDDVEKLLGCIMISS